MHCKLLTKYTYDLLLQVNANKLRILIIEIYIGYIEMCIIMNIIQETVEIYIQSIVINLACIMR